MGQTVPDDWLQWAASAFPSLDSSKLSAQARQFADYWPGVAGANGVKTEWEATWRNWCRRAFPGLEVDAKSAAAPDLVSLPADHPDVLAVAKHRGTPFSPGMSGKVTLARSDIAAARKAMARGDQLPLEATGPP